jgi:DNA-binding NtrC family response regulator
MTDESISVLIVDDEVELTTTLVERLRLRDFACDGVTSGAAALEAMERAAYDVIVLDVKMPGLGGIEVIEQLKQRHPESAVILLTGHGSAQTAENGLAHGAFEYVLKPVKIDALVQLIRRAAGVAGAEGESS